MIDHIFSIICDTSSIDIDTNKISLLNVLEQLKVFSDSHDVSIPIRFEIFSLWARSDSETPGVGYYRIIFSGAGFEREIQSPFKIDLTKVHFFRSRAKVLGIQLKGPGIYRFNIEFTPENDQNWMRVASLPFLVEYQEPEKKVEVNETENNQD
jgi:hypothetical protein